MKKYSTLLILLAFTALSAHIVAQTTGYPFVVTKSGQGKQSLLFIPGFASSGEVWKETTAKFEKDFTCYTLTMAGFAGVASQPDPTIKKWVAGIVAYIKNNKIVQPVIIGHSMGGVMAMAIAAEYPDLPGKIIVVDALPCYSAISNTTFKPVASPDCSAMLTQFKSLSNEQFKQMQTGTMAQMVQDTSMRSRVIEWGLQSDRSTMALQFCDFLNTDLRESISHIQCPALILLENYFVNLKPTLEAQYRNLKTANMRYATKGLHFIMYDDKEWYFAQLTNFLQAK